MNCKYCNAELPEDVTLCPECGKENLEEAAEAVEETAEAVEETVEAVEETAEAAEAVEETAEVTETEETAEAAKPVPGKTSLWVKILAVIGALALVAVLVCAVLYGTGVLTGKMTGESYTVDDATALKEQDTVIATVGSTKLTNGALQVYYWQAVSEFTEYYSYYMDISSLGLDLEQPLDTQYYSEEEGITWQDYFLENALNTWHRYAALSQLAEADGFTLDEESQEYLATIPQQMEEMAVSYGYTTAEEMLAQDLSKACDMDAYMEFLNLNYYAGQYFDNLYLTMEPTMEEIETYYNENIESLASMGISDDDSRVVDVRHILICPQGGTEDDLGNVEYSEAEWEECRAQAQALLDRWLTESGTEEGFAQFATEYTEDSGSQSTGGLYTDVYVGQMVEPFENWCFDENRQYGDTGLVQTDYGYHIMFFVADEETWISDVRSTIVNERSTQLVDGAVEDYPMEVNYKKIILGQAAAE